MKWIVSVPIGNTDLQKNFVCYSKADVERVLEQFKGAELIVEPPALSDNQQVVLDWLQAYADKDSGDKPFQTFFYLWDCIKADRLGRVEMLALIRLSREEQYQVLQAFASWALEQEAAE